MVCLIQCRTNEVGHAGIYYGKLFVSALFYVQHFCYQASALSYNGASQFEVQSLFGMQLQMFAIGCKVCGEIGYCLTVRMLVIDT